MFVVPVHKNGAHSIYLSEIALDIHAKYDRQYA